MDLLEKDTKMKTKQKIEVENDDNEMEVDLLKEKFQKLEEELQKVVKYTDEQIDSIDTGYEARLKVEKKFSEGIFNAKRNMLEQKLKAIQQLFQIYAESRKSEEESGKGRDITDFIS